MLFSRSLAAALMLTSLHAADSAITASVSCPVVKPGGTAQITVTLPSPVAFTHGRFQIDVDPAVFGDISAIHVFSASGDQQGVAKLQGKHADVVFGANSGGFGRLPNVPVAEITVPVIATAPVGATGAVAVQSSSPWYEVSGKRYTVSFQSLGVAVGAGISIQSVVPGGGQLPAGTVVAINGQGFTSSTKLRLDGVAWSNLQLVSSSLLNITLTGPTDLAGKLFGLTDGGGASTRYYSELTPTSIHDETGRSGYFPIFPTATYQATNSTDYELWFENDTLNSIDVVLSPILTACTPCRGLPLPPSRKITVVAGSVYLAFYNHSPFGYYPAQSAAVSSSAPIRLLFGASLPLKLPDLSATELSPRDSNVFVSCSAYTIEYQVGDAPPQPIMCDATLYPPVPIGSVTAGSDDGNPWVQAARIPGSATKFTVSIDPAGLAVGSHRAMVTVALSGGPVGSLHTSITVNVHSDATITADYLGLNFDVSWPLPGFIRVISTGPPIPIAVSSSDSWLIVTPTSATTPATLTVSIAPSARPNTTATITIQGPLNSLVIPASTYTTLHGVVALTAKAGTTRVVTSYLLMDLTGYDLKFATESGGNWLSAVISPGPYLAISADPTGLTVGLYHGTVTATPPKASAATPVTVPVILSIWNDSPPPVVVSPDSLDFSQSPYSAQLSVSTGSVLLPFSVAYDNYNGVYLGGPAAGTTPTSLYIYAAPLYPGTHHVSLTITAPPGSSNSVFVPVTVTAPATPVVDPIRPKISAIVNAGSLLPGSISPGEIVTVFGLVSSVGTAGLNLGSDGKVNRALYGNRVLFNGVAAPLTYMSSAQINAVVPYEIADSSAVSVEIDGGGVHSAPWSVPVAPSAPGLFTQDGTGQGDGAILNQDSSLNTPLNPTSRGSIVQIFLTGEGATNPTGVTGQVTGLDTKNPTQAVTVQIGGVDAKVVSATTAPDAIAGLFQVNAVVPAGSPSGSVPMLVRIGNASSQSTATLSVQ